MGVESFFPDKPIHSSPMPKTLAGDDRKYRSAEWFYAIQLLHLWFHVFENLARKARRPAFELPSTVVWTPKSARIMTWEVIQLLGQVQCPLDPAPVHDLFSVVVGFYEPRSKYGIRGTVADLRAAELKAMWFVEKCRAYGSTSGTIVKRVGRTLRRSKSHAIAAFVEALPPELTWKEKQARWNDAHPKNQMSEDAIRKAVTRAKEFPDKSGHVR